MGITMKLQCVLLTLCTLCTASLSCAATPKHHSEFTNDETTRTVQLCSHDLSNPRLPSRVSDKKMQDVMHQAARNSEEQLINDEAKANAYYERGNYDGPRPNASERTPVGTKTPVIGSLDLVTQLHDHDAGLLSTVFDAYNDHYNLRTGPEDWWYTIIQTVALAIDKNSKKDEVRNFFVQHEGKKKLQVYVGPTICIDCVDYSWFFDQMSLKIAENINVPEYVENIQSDFTTSTAVHQIVAQITLMSSVQEYFEYTMGTLCGIPAIEMKGTRADWERLVTKVQDLRKTLKPIEEILFAENPRNDRNWFDKVEHITQKLLDTYNGQPDEDWWSRAINYQSYGSGAPDFRGWFMHDLLNKPRASTIGSAPSGLVSIPMKIAGEKGDEESAVVAGMIGYKIHQTNGRPSLEPMHGWALLLEEDSVYRPQDSNNIV